MSKIEITRREMDRAFRSHHEATNQLSSSCDHSKLICLFYAAECGLKSLIMKRDNLHTSSGIDKHKFEHDINSMLVHLRSGAELRLPGNNISLESKNPDVQRDTVQSKLNQVWRYGVNIKNRQEQSQITQTLEKICQWVKEQRS